MFDYCFVFSTPELAREKLLEAEIINSVEGNLAENVNIGYSVDDIGLLPIYNSDPDAEVVLGDDWHINVRSVAELSEVQVSLLPESITPTYPKRVWA